MFNDIAYCIIIIWKLNRFRIDASLKKTDTEKEPEQVQRHNSDSSMHFNYSSRGLPIMLR